MALASHVLTEIAEAPFDGEPLIVLRSKQYDTQLDRLRERENERGREVANMAVDLEDVMYLVREVWCALERERHIKQALEGVLAQHERTFVDEMEPVARGIFR